jgi:hypothetical protein
MIEVKPPNEANGEAPYVFLAGSIEQGKAAEWQRQIAEGLADLDIVLLNPRRDDWDADAEQSVDNPYFAAQVSWEIEYLQESDITLFYFQPDTFSPITIGEFYYKLRGFDPDYPSVVVCCPTGYWRKGNIDFMCRHHGVPMVDDIDGLIEKVREWC